MSSTTGLGSMALVSGSKYWEGKIDDAHCGSADNGEPTLLTAARKPSESTVARRRVLEDGEFDMKAKFLIT
jgi:hypothetical protein